MRVILVLVEEPALEAVVVVVVGLFIIVAPVILITMLLRAPPAARVERVLRVEAGPIFIVALMERQEFQVQREHLAMLEMPVMRLMDFAKPSMAELPVMEALEALEA